MLASNASRMLGVVQGTMSKNMNKLSSGLRINGAADDAGGLAISEKMRSQVRGLNQASKNTQDGISLIQTAESALSQTHSILQRMREMTVQSGTATMGTTDRAALQQEFSQLSKEIDDIANKTQFNNQNLLSGAAVNGLTLQTGANVGDQTIVSINAMHASGIGISAGITIDTLANASNAITILDGAISAVSTERSKLGAMQNRFEYKVKNIDGTSENLQSAESRIRDVDMAKEMVEYTKNDIISQAAQAMLAKANQAPQAVLQLLK